MVDLTHRSTKDELMDDPNLDLESLKSTFIEINKVNKVLLGNKITLDAVYRLIQENPKPSYNIVDMGCGDGNMLRILALFLRKKNIKATLIGVDLNKRGLQIAQEHPSDFPEITYMCQDILALDSSVLQCDILLCTLVLHHFSSAQIYTFTQQFTRLSSIAVVINDLRRSRLSHYLFKLFSYLFIKSHVAKHDGLVSVDSAFTKSDLLLYVQKLSHYTHLIKSKYLFRYLWIIYI